MEQVLNQSETATLTSSQRAFKQLRQHLNQRIIGQTKLIDRILIALIADGHILVEGTPGLAKTKIIKELAACLEGTFHRVQFTPDLLPADLTGTEIYRPQDGSFKFQQGPLFHNLILADEINRAPAKVQSALLEAMAERQVTIGQVTYDLPKLFWVMATQNPIEHEGTYPLPEAQKDRFIMHVRIHYPEAQTESDILQLSQQEFRFNQTQIATHVFIPQQVILNLRHDLMDLHMSPSVKEYLVQLIIATRQPKTLAPKLENWIRVGSSPRGTISLDRCARAYAWLHDRDYVTPEDIHSVIYEVLRHRILLTFDAMAEGITPDDVIKELLHSVPVP